MAQAKHGIPRSAERAKKVFFQPIVSNIIGKIKLYIITPIPMDAKRIAVAKPRYLSKYSRRVIIEKQSKNPVPIPNATLYVRNIKSKLGMNGVERNAKAIRRLVERTMTRNPKWRRK